jgi:hypothetical protein
METLLATGKPLVAVYELLAYVVTALIGGIWYYLGGGRHP